MKPAIAFPYADPDGTLFPHLQAILPDLKEHFERAYLCPPLSTTRHIEHIRRLEADDFFTIFPIDRDMRLGEHFRYLYHRAAKVAYPDQIVHLCYLDRVAFALEGKYRDPFLADIDSLSDADVPMIFQRSQLAWDTHPRNYRQLERIVTTVGKNLFGVELDYAWCHIAARAAELSEIMPLVRNDDLSMVAEMIFYMQDHIKTRDVDWLAWEDPFIFSRDSNELKLERENSLDETNKRLRYALPMIETLTRLSTTKLAPHES
jgi:hypothetical protein